LSFQTFNLIKVSITTEVTVFIYYYDQIEYSILVQMVINRQKADKQVFRTYKIKNSFSTNFSLYILQWYSTQQTHMLY